MASDFASRTATPPLWLNDPSETQKHPNGVGEATGCRLAATA
jgi:hypothetical protein